MSQVEFEDQINSNIKHEFGVYNKKTSLLSRLHLVNSEEGEQKVLITFSIVLLISSMYLYWQYIYVNSRREVVYGLSNEIIQKLPIEIQQKIISAQQ